MCATKQILIDVSNVKFLISLNYFPMALGKLLNALRLTELRKGSFSFFFSSLQYFKYSNFCWVDSRFEVLWFRQYEGGAQVKFAELAGIELLFLISRKNNTTVILHQWCRNYDQGLSQISPAVTRYFYSFLFTEASTIVSAWNKVYRRNFLKSNFIGIIPNVG